MTQNKNKEAIDYIKSQLADGYIDLGLHNENEIEIVRKAVNAYINIPEVIQELERLKISMDGQIFYNESSRLIYEEKMGSVNETINEAIRIVKQILYYGAYDE